MAVGHEPGGHVPGGHVPGGHASDEPEVFDLGPMSRGDAASDDPVEGAARDPTTPARQARQLAALACVLGLVVGAVGYGLWDSHQDGLAARARPVLLGQVVATTADEQGQFYVTVALANEGASTVTVHQVALPSAPADVSGREQNRSIEPGTIATLLVGGVAQCSEPVPALDRVRAIVSAKDGGRRTVTVPLAMSPNAVAEFSAKRRYACAGATTTPRVYSSEMQLLDPASSATGDAVRLSMTLEIEGRDLGMLTELRPVTSAFSVTSPDLPVSLSANGQRRIAIETTWRINDCAAAARATTADASLVPIIDGTPQGERLQVWGRRFRRAGAPGCPPLPDLLRTYAGHAPTGSHDQGLSTAAPTTAKRPAPGDPRAAAPRDRGGAPGQARRRARGVPRGGDGSVGGGPPTEGSIVRPQGFDSADAHLRPFLARDPGARLSNLRRRPVGLSNPLFDRPPFMQQPRHRPTKCKDLGSGLPTRRGHGLHRTYGPLGPRPLLAYPRGDHPGLGSRPGPAGATSWCTLGNAGNGPAAPPVTGAPHSRSPCATGPHCDPPPDATAYPRGMLPEPPDAAPAEPAMDAQTRVELAATFTNQEVAVAYDARPSYPRPAVDWMVGTRERRRLLDLGAGTGKLTEVLVAAGHDVVAVDVSAAMLRQLTDRLAGVETAAGSAEHIPVPDHSVDIVMVAQAFHWFDPEPALREIARVLRTAGTLALVWNIRDESDPGVREMSRALGGLHARVASTQALSDAAAFGPVSEADFSIAQRLDRAGFRRLALSRSYVWKLPPSEQARTLTELDGIFDRYSVDGALTIPYVTRCYRASPV